MRNFARFTTSLYNDPDFTSLTFEQQGVYFMLGLQPQVTAAGTLALTWGRFAGKGLDCTRTRIEELVVALGAHAAKHVVVDQDTEELIIRKFMKWDGGWSNSKRLPVIFDAIDTLSSVHIRDIAVDELCKISTGIPHSDNDGEARNTLSRKLSDRFDTACRIDRLRVNLGDHSALDLNPNPEPGAVAPVAAIADDPLSEFCPKHQPFGTDEPCGACGTRRKTVEARKRAALDDEVAVRRALAEAIAACTDCNDKGFLENPTTGQIIGRCPKHFDVSSPGGVAG